MPRGANSLVELCRMHGVVACYAFGSREHDALALLEGGAVAGGGSDLDIGVVFADEQFSTGTLPLLQIALEDLFAPLRVDLVPLDRVDPLFQFSGISGTRLAAPAAASADRFELTVMRRAAELLPVQRRLEIESFGATSQ